MGAARGGPAGLAVASRRAVALVLTASPAPMTRRRAVALVLTASLMALALSGCETSAEKSAQLERAAKRVVGQTQHGLSIARASSNVRVLAARVLSDAEGAAVTVTLRNSGPRALRDVPIAITVRDAAGGALYQNDAPGLEATLTSVALLEPGREFTWIDDQVPAAGRPTSASALVGEAPPAPRGTPRIVLAGVHATTEAGGAGMAGTVVNDSAVTQRGLVVYGVARRGTTIVAAGRAVLAEVAAHSSSPFQVLFIGSARGAHVEASAPPSTF